MTDGTIIRSVGMTIQAILADTSHMDVGVLTNFLIFLVVVTAPAVHRKNLLIFRLVAMMTGFTLDIVGIG